MRVEDGPEPVVFLLRDRVGSVIVALGTADGHAEESLGGVFEGVLNPLFAAEHLVIADQKTGGAQGVRVVRGEFVGRKHFQHHPVVALVRIDGFDDPVAPAPDVGLAVADLIAPSPARPIAVPPDIHPMPRPAFAMARILEQAIDESFVGFRRAIGKEGFLFLGRGQEADQVE